MITTFLFDLGGVLFTNGSRKFIEDISKQSRIPKNEVHDVINGEIGTQYREGKISRDHFWQHIRAMLQLEKSADVLEKQWIEKYELIEGTKNIIQFLSLNYKIFYLSDNVHERVAALDKKYQFLKLFRGGIFSHDAGVRKPNPVIYRMALSLTKSIPEETVYVDDKAHFLIPAQQMGIHTILFATPEKLRQDLRQLSVVFD